MYMLMNGYKMVADEIKQILFSDPEMMQRINDLPLHMTERNVQDFFENYCEASIYRLMHRPSFPLLSLGCRRVIVPRPLFIQWYLCRCMYITDGPLENEQVPLQIDEGIRIKFDNLPLHLNPYTVQSFLDFCPATIYRMIREGKIPHIDTGVQRPLIPRPLFQDWYCKKFAKASKTKFDN